MKTFDVFNIGASNGKIFKLLISEMPDGHWAGTVCYVDGDSNVFHKNFAALTKADLYQQAKKWVLDNVDPGAEIDAL